MDIEVVTASDHEASTFIETLGVGLGEGERRDGHAQQVAPPSTTIA